MESHPVLFGLLGVIVSLLLGVLIWLKLGPSFNAVSDAFAHQRMEEMRESLFNVSGSSCGMMFVMLFLFVLIILPCVLCFFSALLLSSGLGMWQ